MAPPLAAVLPSKLLVPLKVITVAPWAFNAPPLPVLPESLPLKVLLIILTELPALPPLAIIAPPSLLELFSKMVLVMVALPVLKYKAPPM